MAVTRDIDTNLRINGSLSIGNTEVINSFGEVSWERLVSIQDASTEVKGVVKLSSATNSQLENQAATSKAVYTAYNLANSKWTWNTTEIQDVKVNNAVNADTVNSLTVLTAVPANAVFTDTVYTHPGNHPPSIITQDEDNRFVTDTQISTWNAKQDALSGDVTGHYHSSDRLWANITDKPTSTVANIDDAVSKRHSRNADLGSSSTTFGIYYGNTLSSSGYGIYFGGNSLSTNPYIRWSNVTGSQRFELYQSYNTPTWAELRAGSFKNSAGIEVVYTNDLRLTNDRNPVSHASSHITDGSDVIPDVVADGNSGLMSGLDKTKLDGIATGANKYTHPTYTTINSDNSNGVVIQDISVNSMGHVTNIGTVDLDDRYALTHSHPYDNYQKWVLKANTETTGVDITSGTIVDIKGSGATTVSRSGSTLTISSANTTYSAGNGLNLSSGKFSIKLGTTPGLAVDINGLTNSDKGSSQSIFKNITVGGDTSSASSNNDTLTFAASGDIQVSLSNKTVTYTHNDSDHNTFPTLSGNNTLTGNNTFTASSNAIKLKPTSQRTPVNSEPVVLSGLNSTNLVNNPIDSLTAEVWSQTGKTGVKYSLGIDYTIDYRSGTVTRVSGGNITSGQTVYVTYTPTNELLVIEESSSNDVVFSVDNKGNIYGKSVTVTLASSSQSQEQDVQGDFTVQGNFIVAGNTTLGDTSNDSATVKGTLYINNGTTNTLTISSLGSLQVGTIEVINSSGQIPWAVLSNTVPSASTSAKGIVQLNNTTSSTSTSQAATANAVKSAYDLADSANTLAGSKWEWNATEIQGVKVDNAVNADTVNNLTVLTAVPANAKFTDTVYSHPNHTGDVTSTGDGNTVIGANKVLNTMLRDSAGLSVIGRSASTSGDPADIVAGTDGYVLRRSGTTLGFGTIVTAGIANKAVTLAKVQDINSEVILGRVTTSAGVIEQLTATQVRTLLNVADGANNYTHPNHTGDVTSVGDGATTIGANKVTFAKMQTISTSNILGRKSASTGNIESLTASDVRTILNVADGANNYSHPTGFTNQPATALSGANVISQITVNANGHVTGVNSRSLTPANIGAFSASGGTINGSIKVYTAGGTNKDNTIRIGDRDGSYGFTLKYVGTGEGNNNSLELYTDNQTEGEFALKSFEIRQDGILNVVTGIQENGTALSSKYASISHDIDSSHTGTLSVGKGGTGATSFTAGRILFGNGASAINTSSSLFWDNTNGRLGISTSSPSAKLDIISSSSSLGVLRLITSLSTSLSLTGISFGVCTSPYYSKSAIVHQRKDSNGKGDLVFLVDSSNDASDVSVGDEKMRITSDGKVGVGTSSPGESIETLGNVKAVSYKTANWVVSQNANGSLIFSFS